MANLHSRSNSLPSQTHPLVESVEDQLCRLKSSEATSTSSVSSKLAALRELHEGIDDLIQIPSFQQALSQERGECWINELLDGSLRLVDLCGVSRDVVYLTKESVQDLESSIRRSREKTETADHINTYLASRKKINKMVNKNLKSFHQTCTTIPAKDCDLKTIGTLLKETESLDFSILQSVLILLSGEKEKSGSLLSKFTQTSRVYSEHESSSFYAPKVRKSMDGMTLKNLLKISERNIQELEEGLESLFRSLVKTRVSLLNLFSQ